MSSSPLQSSQTPCRVSDGPPDTDTRHNGGSSQRGAREEEEGGRGAELPQKTQTGGEASDQPIPALLLSPPPEEEVGERVTAVWTPPVGWPGPSVAGGCQRVEPTECCSRWTDDSNAESGHRTPKQHCVGRRLSNLVATAAQSQQFFQGLGRMRERVAAESRDKEPVPVFNKRLFASHGSVVITAEARRLMARNGRIRPGQDFQLFTKSELHIMRSVVDGLRLIHRGQDYVKDALSHVITMESYSPYQYIVKRPHEAQLSCYYILHGGVQVTYDMDVTETRSVFQPDIIYNHGTGEFLGLVSPDGLSDDLSPPATVYTTEPTEFLRVDRQKFHAVVERIGHLQRQEKLSFLRKPSNALASLPPEALEKVLPHIHKMDYPPNKTILHQDHPSDYLYFILSGRCQLSRDVFIPEIDRDVSFYLDCREQDDFFAEECILEEGGGSICHVTTTSHTSCFLMHKAALEVVSKDVLHHGLQSRRHYFPPDHELRDRGYRKCQWDGYKHSQVRQSLEARGCLYILARAEPEKVRSRPPSAQFQQRENLFRFMAQGANYQPVFKRVRSATVRSSPNNSATRLPLRPCTALGTSHPDLPPPPPAYTAPALHLIHPRLTGEDVPDTGDEKDDDVNKTDDVTTASVDSLGSTPVTTSFVRMLEKNLPKGVLQKILGVRGSDMDPRWLGRAMEMNPELGRQLRMAWELHQHDQQDGFTKTTVLVTMKTDDIVRKAKAEAEKQTLAAADSEEEGEGGDQWNSSLQQENTNARTQIAGDKFRAAFLRRKINVLQSKRAKARADHVYRSAKPGQVPRSAERVKGREAGTTPERFYLDEIQSKYQGLDPQDAGRKLSATGYQLLFVSKMLNGRSRSMHDIRETKRNESEAGSGDGTSTKESVTVRHDLKQETTLPRRRSAEQTTSPLAGHVSIRKDAPVTWRALTMPLRQSRSDSDVSSPCSGHRPVSKNASPPRDIAAAGRKHLPHPKLQVNR